MGVIDFLGTMYSNTKSSLPPNYQVLFDLACASLILVIYAIFIWKFHKFIAKREIIELNLKQYNYSKNPKLEKTIAIGLYTLEYIIILPFLVLFWYAILTLFFILVAETEDVKWIILISAAIVITIRASAYVSESLARELAKFFPFAVIATYLLNPNFFNTEMLSQRFGTIPTLLDEAVMIIVFILIVELVLRFTYSIREYVRS